MRATLILSLVWAALIVFAASVGRPSSLGLCGLCVSALKSFLGKVWFWETCHVDCAWCKRRMHRAIWPRAYRVGTVVTPAISHTICPACFVEVKEKSNGSSPSERKAQMKAELISLLMISKQLQ